MNTVFSPPDYTEEELEQQEEKQKLEKEKKIRKSIFKSEGVKNFNNYVYYGYREAKGNSIFNWNNNLNDCIMYICKCIENEIDCDKRLTPDETLAVAVGVGYYLKEIGHELKS